MGTYELTKHQEFKEFFTISKARHPQLAHATAGVSLVLLFQSVSYLGLHRHVHTCDSALRAESLFLK